ncbi:hypothetical protein [Streptomyces sp. MB09-02B]|uniref:hypothetical protein n=1 Tax=Streptomyces sp. MB09-02B TaxID=3028667 RepID=UPI0029BD906B|nr:hypothetical protein [Streptomyces sp. MB09-02B]MDX3641652.1 hypothetical protein [Streptomyces sp. MB09-02B]
MTTEQAPRSTVRCTEQEAQANLLAVLQLCAAGKLRCSQTTHRLSAAAVTAVAEILQDGDFYPADPIAAFAWPLLLQAGGLAELASGKLALTTRGRAALTEPPHDALRLLWQRWLNRAVLDEFSRIEEIKGQRAAAVLSAAGPRRKTVGEALAACAPGQWTQVDDLFAAMRKSGLDFTIARSDRALWKLYLQDPQYGSLGYDGFHDWPLLQGRYTLAVLFEYAATLGLIDIEYVPPVGAREDYCDNWGGDDLDQLSRYDGLLALRLNPLSAYATGRASVCIPASAPVDTDCRSVKVLPNFDIVALDGLRPTRRSAP